MPLLKKLEFWNRVPVELMGELPDDEHEGGIDTGLFEKTFEYPPVGDDYYAKMYAIATFENNYRRVASADYETTLNVTKAPLFVKPEPEYPTETTITIEGSLDCTYITQYVIDDDFSVSKFVLYWRLEGAGTWETVDITEWTRTDNVFNFTYDLDITDNGIYEMKLVAYDRTVKINEAGTAFEPSPEASNFSPDKYINKNILYSDTGDDWYWDVAASTTPIIW